jgi:BMFP domain-containing protein YqiC
MYKRIILCGQLLLIARGVAYRTGGEHETFSASTGSALSVCQGARSRRRGRSVNRSLNQVVRGAGEKACATAPRRATTGGGCPLKGQCPAIKANGQRCQRSADGSHGYCWAHDPANAQKRHRQASRAAKSKSSKEIRDLKKQLEDLAENVLNDSVDKGDGAVVNQILNTRARLIALERQIKETEELEARLEALEQSQEGQGGGSRWRA